MLSTKRLVFEEGQFGKWLIYFLFGLLGGDFVMLFFTNYRPYTSEFEIVLGLVIIAYCAPKCWRIIKEAVIAGGQKDGTEP